jgi:hypothetical protein
MRASSGMSENLRTSFPKPLAPVALVLALLGSVNMVAAQSAPPPAPRQVIAAPPPAPAAQAAPPAAAPPAAQPAQGVPGAYAQPPGGYPQQQAYPPPATYQQPPPGTYQQPPPGTYQQPPPGTYQQPPPGTYQQPPPGYVAYPNSQPLYQPSGQPVPFRRPRASRGLMISGISVLGASYLLAMSIGVGLLSDNDNYNNDDDCNSNCRAVGRWLFVPVAGPFVAMSRAEKGDWGLWFLGMIEVVGAGLMTGGIIKYKNSKRAADMQGYSWTLPHDRKLTVDVASSARFAGPRLRLDF